MGFKTYFFYFCSFDEGIYNCCLALCCFFLFFRLYCYTNTDQRRLIFLSPEMTGMQSRPSGNESTLSTTDEKKTKCMFPSMACPFLLVETTQPNTMGVTKGQGRGISSGFYMYMYKRDPSYFLSGSLQILTNFLLELLH